MILQEKNPAGFRQIMEKYRQDLLTRNKNGNLPKDAGPVTLGSRLFSSHFPEGYEAISYGRGTWLFHMLRCMLQDAAAEDQDKDKRTAPRPNEGEDPFVQVLRKLRERYEGKAISTRQLLQVFAESLPPSLRYEGEGFAGLVSRWLGERHFIAAAGVARRKVHSEGECLVATGSYGRKIRQIRW